MGYIDIMYGIQYLSQMKSWNSGKFSQEDIQFLADASLAETPDKHNGGSQLLSHEMKEQKSNK